MSDKFSFYQTEGLWGIIENASDEKQTSIKSYFGSDLIIKRLNEQAEQIDQLKQQLAKKDKEIERLCNDCDKLWLSREQCDIDRMKAEINQTQLAIQKLEKLKNYCDNQFTSWENMNFNEAYDNKDVSHAYYDVGFVITQQINELKGEKDEKL